MAVCFKEEDEGAVVVVVVCLSLSGVNGRRAVVAAETFDIFSAVGI